MVWGREWYIRVRPEPVEPDGRRAPRLDSVLDAGPVSPGLGARERSRAGDAPTGCCGCTAAAWWWPNAGSSWRRSWTPPPAEGFDLVNSFTVDDNVYLVLRRPGLIAGGRS